MASEQAGRAMGIPDGDMVISDLIQSSRVEDLGRKLNGHAPCHARRAPQIMTVGRSRPSSRKAAGSEGAWGSDMGFRESS